MYVYTYVRVYIHRYIHTHTRTRTYTQKDISKQQLLVSLSQELFCPIQNCLNILQPNNEDIVRKRKIIKSIKLKLVTKHPMNLYIVWNSVEPKKGKKKEKNPLGIDVLFYD